MAQINNKEIIYDHSAYREDNEDTDSDFEWEYYNYGTLDDGSFLVAEGGLENGNDYAIVYCKKDKIKGEKWFYKEFGKNPFGEYLGYSIEWSSQRMEDGRGGFYIM